MARIHETNEALKSLAGALAQARLDDRQIDVSALDVMSSIEDAWAVQALLEKTYNSRQTGYKIGATSPQAQKMVGCDGPFYGPMFDRDHFANGSSMPLSSSLLGVECEFAFQFGKDVAAADIADDRDALHDSIKACHVALELIGRRTKGTGLPPLFGAIADFGANFAFIPGDEVTNWRDLDLSQVEVHGLVNDEETNQGSGAAVLGNPLNALAWLMSELATKGSTLQAGQWVTTGTCLGVVAPKKGAKIEGRFGDLGSVFLQFN